MTVSYTNLGRPSCVPAHDRGRKSSHGCIHPACFHHAPNKEKLFELFPRRKERRKQLAGTMSGGEQQMLSMGRALMSNASMLMLDEPSMGLSPLLVQDVYKRQVR